VARSEALPSVSDELTAAATVDQLVRALAELAEPYQSVVRLRYFDGLSTAEIAERTGASELAVRKRLWRARGKLRAALGGEDDTLFMAFVPWLAARVRGSAAPGAGRPRAWRPAWR
jgi:RNA polymerase sigma-70 factor (ECF subfamily)